MSDFRTDSFESGMNSDRVNLPLLESRVIPDNHGCNPRQGDRKMDSIAALCHELNELVRQGCQYPPQHPQQRKIMDQIVRKIEQSRQLYLKRTPENAQHYPDALQQTWLYFSKNLYQTYDPNFPGSCLIPWLRTYLEKRLLEFNIGDCTRTTDPETGQRKRRKISYAQPVADSEGNLVNPLDFIPAQGDPQPLLNDTLDWVTTDPSGILQQVTMRDRQDITAQVVLKLLLPPDCLNQTEIAKHLHLPQPSSIQTFYKKSLRLLLEYWELDDPQIQEILAPKKTSKKQPGGES